MMNDNMSKLEEALEIKSLRRVISSYLNYAVAMEEDVRRWERSYKKLPPAHKELLAHLPAKYEEVRRCLSANFRFILTMLQAFEPPFDMSQDYDVSCKQSESHCHSCCGLSESVSKSEPTQGVGCGQPLPSPDGCCNGNSRNNRCETNIPIENEAGNFATSQSDDKAKHSKVKICGMDFQDPALQLHIPPSDVDKVRCMIRNIVRDWTAEGAYEREQCYTPILEELKRCFPNRSNERPPSCLVPGAGLGRLACEISCLGFECQGNEFSYYVMICSSFILNHTQVPNEWVIYPWIHSNCNMISDANQLQPVYFPDLHPGSAGITEGFSMCAGDFVEVYGNSSQEGMWDAVATCFFIDTAHNIVEYIEIIAKILKPGGVWINLGPLLYHFADAVSYAGEEEMSVEISLEDVKKIAFHYGLEMQRESTIETTYTANQRSMMKTRYTAAFWTMTKGEKKSTLVK